MKEDGEMDSSEEEDDMMPPPPQEELPRVGFDLSKRNRVFWGNYVFFKKNFLNRLSGPSSMLPWTLWAGTGEEREGRRTKMWTPELKQNN